MPPVKISHVKDVESGSWQTARARQGHPPASFSFLRHQLTWYYNGSKAGNVAKHFWHGAEYTLRGTFLLYYPARHTTFQFCYTLTRAKKPLLDDCSIWSKWIIWYETFFRINMNMMWWFCTVGCDDEFKPVFYRALFAFPLLHILRNLDILTSSKQNKRETIVWRVTQENKLKAVMRCRMRCETVRLF